MSNPERRWRDVNDRTPEIDCDPRTRDPHQLADYWRCHADQIEAYASSAAAAFRRAAEQLEYPFVTANKELLTLPAAAKESNYTSGHIGRMIREGKKAIHVQHLGAWHSSGSRLVSTPDTILIVRLRPRRRFALFAWQRYRSESARRSLCGQQLALFAGGNAPGSPISSSGSSGNTPTSSE